MGLPSEIAVARHPAVRTDAISVDDPAVVAILRDPIVIAAIIAIVSTKEQPATLGTITTVAANPATVTLLVPNALRRGATFFNGSVDRILYIKLDAAATAVDFTERLMPLSHYEIPWPSYTGIITGIWTAGVGGFCQVTELT